MVQYYRTRGGLYYKEYADGHKVRVSKGEFSQTGGAAKKQSPKKSRSKSKSRRSPRKSPMRYTPGEQQCIDYVQAKITENKALPKAALGF